MSKSIREKYLIDPSKIMVPDANLGTFIEGYQEVIPPFKWKWLFWNLLPCAGQLFFCIYLFPYLKNFILNYYKSNRVFIYENGFIVQEVRLKKKGLEYYVFNYSELKGISVTKTRKYNIIYGIRVYDETSVEVNAIDEDNREYEVIKGFYKDELDKKANHGFIGCVADVIMEHWNPIALQRFNDELAQKGYGTFRSDFTNIEISRNYIKVGKRVVERPFRYGLNQGMLYIRPQTEGNAHFKQEVEPVEINIAEMYNKDIFLLGANQLLGIDWR